MPSIVTALALSYAYAESGEARPEFGPDDE